MLEDIGALVGLCFALAGVILADVTNEARWDAAGSLAIGVLLVVIAIILAVEMASHLVGEAAAPDVVARFRGVLEASPECRAAHRAPHPARRPRRRSS